MRTGACAVQQALTGEAAAALKRAVALARRRGHAQITPLHVAAALLAGGDLFRRACLQSQPRHPRALELCFNVALNRLPTLSPPPLSSPAFSNALVAALKRAQAHQRRGTGAVDPPLTPLKVELEQLVISILDDPSVSRVMREAGFSSASVKSNLELDCASSSSSSSLSRDLELLCRALLNKKNAVVVGDSVSYSELLVMELMSRVERGGDEVPEELRSTQWVKLSHLRKKTTSLLSSGAIIYLGDLSREAEEEEDPAAGEIGRAISEARVSTGGKIWMVAIADLQSYLEWKKRQPLLEIQWAFQAVSVPSGGPALSLHVSGDSLRLHADDGQEKLACCRECASSLEREAFSVTSPFFLRQSREGQNLTVQLRRKWNWVCRTLHQGSRSSGLLLSPPGERNDSRLLERETWEPGVKTGLSLGGSLSSDSGTSAGKNNKREGQATATRQKKKKKSERDEDVVDFDLNLSPDEDEAVPSDLTHETSSGLPLCLRISS